MEFYKGKTVWIIGGTSGIGLSVAKQLINVCSVIVSGRDTLKINDFTSPNLIKISLDVTNGRKFAEVANSILENFQKVDIILFCAGTYEPMSLKNFDAKHAQKILETNLISMINFIDIVPYFFGKCSLIGIISSVASYFGMPNSLFYGASKAGLSNLTESLYIELKKYEIDVKLINPGFVRTPLTDKNSFKMPFIISSEKAGKIILKNLPRKKFEISFPFFLVLIMKILKFLPHCVRFKLFS